MVVRFSSRLPPDLTPTELSQGMQDARDGRDGIDLTLSNPTVCGFDYPHQAIGEALRPREFVYAPKSLGLDSARSAVATYISARGVPTVADQVVVTASTSESYAMLFKLLCDPGDAVAVPTPSYPLIEHLAELEGVRACGFPLRYHGRWQFDLAALHEALDSGVRAVVVVSPNNPTGSCPTEQERAAIWALCFEYGVPLIADQVFAPYGFDGRDLPTLAGVGAATGAVAADRGPLLFILDGLSKAAGLPQLKIGWISIRGPAEAARDALQGLEWIADAYLSVATPTQAGLPALLALAPGLQEQIRGRVNANRRLLASHVAELRSFDLLQADGGWYGVLRHRQTAGTPTVDEERLVADLAQQAGVLLHPGFFYGLEDAGHLVVSLLPPPMAFAKGLERLTAFLGSSRKLS